MFRNFTKAALLAALAIAGASPLVALPYDPTRIPQMRTCELSQNVCYVRATINFNDPNIANGVQGFTLPPNAYILAMDANVTTAFNATSTNTLAIGTAAANADFLATSGITMGSTGVTHLTTAAGLGVVVTGNVAKQTGLNGGVPMFFKYAQTGTPATAGVVVVVITFAKNDDK